MEINKHIKCPITSKIFLSPVIASDGNTYEHEAIMEWINENGLTPYIPNNIITNKILIPNLIVKNIVEELIKSEPELIHLQYINKNFNLSILQFATKINGDIYRKILFGQNINTTKSNIIYTKYILKNEGIFTNLENELFAKYFIDNVDDFDFLYKFTFNRKKIKCKLLQLVCRFSSLESIKYLIDKCEHLKISLNYEEFDNLAVKMSEFNIHVNTHNFVKLKYREQKKSVFFESFEKKLLNCVVQDLVMGSISVGLVCEQSEESEESEEIGLNNICDEWNKDKFILTNSRDYNKSSIFSFSKDSSISSNYPPSYYAKLMYLYANKTNVVSTEHNICFKYKKDSYINCNKFTDNMTSNIDKFVIYIYYQENILTYKVIPLAHRIVLKNIHDNNKYLDNRYVLKNNNYNPNKDILKVFPNIIKCIKNKDVFDINIAYSHIKDCFDQKIAHIDLISESTPIYYHKSKKSKYTH
jgi:hypothetical protein